MNKIKLILPVLITIFISLLAGVASACTSDGTPEGDEGFRWCSCVISNGNYYFGSQKKCYPSGFNGTRRQLNSNAGKCENCTIRIATDPRSEAFVVNASNGWKAYMRYSDKKHTSAQGSGRWPADWGVYSNKNFQITLQKTSRRGQIYKNGHYARDFHTTMRIKTEGVQGEIVATFGKTYKKPTLRDLGLQHLAK